MLALTEPAEWRSVPQRVLMRRLYHFNHCPADYLHPSRRSVCAPQVGDKVWHVANARRWLSAHILRQASLESRSYVPQNLGHLTLALLEPERLLRLARAVGATALGPLVRQSLLRSEVVEWKRRLTPEIYEFAMTTACLLPSAPEGHVCEPDSSAEEVGCAWIAAAWSDAPEELKLRADWKLPVDIGATTSAAATTARQFVICVLNALEPQWCLSLAKLKG